MRNALIIARRELEAYYVSPIAYVVTAAFLIVMGVLFYLILLASREATLRYLYGNAVMILFFMLSAPVLTMRLLAEEQRSGTIELLLTSPVRDWEIVVGKFLAALVVLIVILILALYYPLVLSSIGKPDWGPIWATYLGLLLMGASMIALGVFTSALTRNQIVAAVLGAALILFLVFCGFAADFTQGFISDFFREISILTHYFDFLKGVVDTAHVVYFLSLTVVGLFLATAALDARRW